MNVSGQGNAANTAPLNQPLPGGAGNPAGTYPGGTSVAQPQMHERPYAHEHSAAQERPYESGGTTDFVGHHGGTDPTVRPGEATNATEKPIGSSTGTTGATSATGNKPSMGQKVLGTVETVVGKATKNEHMVAEGQAKKMGAGSGGV